MGEIDREMGHRRSGQGRCADPGTRVGRVRCADPGTAAGRGRRVGRVPIPTWLPDLPALSALSALLGVTMATALVGLLPLPARADDDARLQGRWDCVSDGTRAVLEFLSGTELSYDGLAMTYQVADDAIVVQDEYGTVPYYYGFEGDVLGILSPDGSVMWCERSARSVPSPVSSPVPSGAAVDGGDGRPGLLVPGPDWPAYEPPAAAVSEDSPSPQALLYKFAGRWEHVTTNTVTTVSLHPDGTYESSYEARYGGRFEDQGGDQAGGWGTAGSEQDRGRWMIEGSLREGTLTLIGPDGDRSAYHYQVHVEGGEVYWGEYLFDGELYQVSYVFR